MAEKKIKMWQCPKWISQKGYADVHSFLLSNVRDGEEYYRSSPSYKQLQESIRIITGDSTEELERKQKDARYSRVHSNRLKRNLREMVNALADVRFTPGYNAGAKEYQHVAMTMNRVSSSWYADQFVDVEIKKALQWMAITTCCYLELQYKTVSGERDRADIALIPHSAFDVVMTQVPASGDLQEAYTVTIIRDLPVWLAHAIWYSYQELLVPDRETPEGWKEKATDAIRDVFSNEPTRRSAKNPTVRMYYQYVRDLSINTTGKRITMGLDPNSGERTAWTYEVPYLGEMIPAGYDSNGNMVYRKANRKDAMMFPGRRLLVGTESHLIYDGPSWNMHGKVPLVKISADPWPFADFSMVHDVANLQETINEMERMIHQTARNKMNPSILYNMRAMDRGKAKAFRTEITGQRIGYNGAEGQDPLKPVFPQNFYEVQGWQEQLVKYLGDAMDYQMGIRDIVSLAKARKGSNPDSMEKDLSGAGPIVKGISRDMERAFRDIAEMYKYDVLQFKTTPEIMSIVGIDGITPEHFDFDPGNLIPSHLPGEDEKKPSMYTALQRAKWLGDHIHFFIVPNTLHQVTQTEQKMMYMQLWRGGFPLDPWTLAEVFSIGNFGPKPEGTNDIFSRYMKWQEIMLELKAKMEMEAKDLQSAMGLQPNAPNMGPHGGQRGTGGRPPSGQTAPHITPGNAQRNQRVRESK